MKKVLRRTLKVLLILVLVVLLVFSGIRLYVVLSTHANVRKPEDLAEEIEKRSKLGLAPEFDAILVLGAAVYRNQEPSPVLRNRLSVAQRMYDTGASTVLIVSGDHQPGDYDEVDIMARWLVNNSVPRNHVERDYKGFSTYESVVRVAKEGKYHKILIVSQRYHLYRALFIAKAYGLDATGVVAENVGSAGAVVSRIIREWLASANDLWKTVTRKEIPE